MAAATLTSPLGTPTGRNSATLTLTSNQATGTVYWVVTASVTTPSHAQIVAGNDNSGNPALASGSKAAALSNSITMTMGETPVRLFAHFTQVNGGAENSTPVTDTAGFFLHGVFLGTLGSNGTSSIVECPKLPYLRVSGTFGSGTFTWYYLDARNEWVALSSGAVTSASQLAPLFHRPVVLKGTLSGATNPDLDWEIR